MKRGKPYCQCKSCERSIQLANYHADIELGRARNAANQARRRAEDAPAVKRIKKRAWENGGKEKRVVALARTKADRPFVWKSWKYNSYYGVKLDPVELEGMWNRQEGKCGLSGRQMDVATAELDHIVPVSRGGSLEISNLRWACPVANQAKHNLMDEEFGALCADVAEYIGRQFLAQRASMREAA